MFRVRGIFIPRTLLIYCNTGRYLSVTYRVPGAMLGSRDTAVNSSERVPVPQTRTVMVKLLELSVIQTTHSSTCATGSPPQDYGKVYGKAPTHLSTSPPLHSVIRAAERMWETDLRWCL